MEGKVALKFSVIGCSSQLSSLLGRKRVLLLVLSFSRKTRKIVSLLVGNLETMQISACVCVCASTSEIGIATTFQEPLTPDLN